MIANLYLDLAELCCSAGLYSKSTAALRRFFIILDTLFFEVQDLALRVLCGRSRVFQPLLDGLTPRTLRRMTTQIRLAPKNRPTRTARGGAERHDRGR